MIADIAAVLVGFGLPLFLTQDTCKPIVSCQTIASSTGNFQVTGPEQGGSCVCHYEEVGEIGFCATKNCNVNQTVTPQWGVIGGASGKSVNGADTTTCQTSGNGIAEVCKNTSCGTTSNELKWKAYSDTSCVTLSQFWVYKVVCLASQCSDGECQR